MTPLKKSLEPPLNKRDMNILWCLSNNGYIKKPLLVVYFFLMNKKLYLQEKR